MVAVFAGMATGDLVMFQQIGFGLAVAVALDATVVRIVVVPSAMALLGRWNWYLPRWLEWLPHVSLDEGAAGDGAADLHGPAPLADAGALARRRPARLVGSEPRELRRRVPGVLSERTFSPVARQRRRTASRHATATSWAAAAMRSLRAWRSGESGPARTAEHARGVIARVREDAELESLE